MFLQMESRLSVPGDGCRSVLKRLVIGMSESDFDGEYWNVDAKTSSITRFHFVRRGNGVYASAWGSCFPEDCEWGETELHLLDEHDGANAATNAFATWNADSEPSHCLMTIVDGLLTVTTIAIRSEFPSYRTISTFRKDAVRSAEAQHPDPLAKFRHMWDGSQPGWKLIQYDTDVFLVEFNFDETGPTRSEIPAIIEFIGTFHEESEDQMWERLRGCSGIGLGKPLGRTELNRLQTRQRESDLKVTVCTIGPDDYLVLSPDGHHFDWINFLRYRRPVIERMIDAGVLVVSGQLK